MPWQGAYRSTAGAEGQAPLRARRLGPHRRRDQPAGEEEAQPLDRQDARRCRPIAEAWLAEADEHPGSWWTDWSAWLAPFGGKQVAAPKTPGNGKYKAIEPAPGRYVKAKGLSRRPRVAPSSHRHRQENSMSTDIVIVAAARTAVGKFGGTLAKMPAPELGAAVIADLLERAKLDRRPDRRGHPRPGADRRLGPEPGAPGGDQERPAAERAGADDQRGLRLGPEGGDARGAGDPRRRLRDRASPAARRA